MLAVLPVVSSDSTREYSDLEQAADELSPLQGFDYAYMFGITSDNVADEFNSSIIVFATLSIVLKLVKWSDSIDSYNKRIPR